jgi:hypothetical protein
VFNQDLKRSDYAALTFEATHRFKQIFPQLKEAYNRYGNGCFWEHRESDLKRDVGAGTAVPEVLNPDDPDDACTIREIAIYTEFSAALEHTRAGQDEYIYNDYVALNVMATNHAIAHGRAHIVFEGKSENAKLTHKFILRDDKTTVTTINPVTSIIDVRRHADGIVTTSSAFMN